MRRRSAGRVRGPDRLRPMLRRRPAPEADLDSLHGAEAQLFRAHLLHVTRRQPPPADGWARLAARLQTEPAGGARPIPPRRWRVPPVAGWHGAYRLGFVFTPMLVVGLLTFCLHVLPFIETGTPFDYATTAPTVVRERGEVSTGRTVSVESKAVREWRQARVLAYTNAFEAIDSSDVGSSIGRGQPSRSLGGAVSPRDLIPGVQRDAINPFGKRPRPAVGEPTLPARPGQFRFTTA